MATEFNQLGDVLNIKPEGRIDTTTSPILEKEIHQYLDDTIHVIMDFENVDYISSGGMRVLLSLQQQLIEKDGTLKIINVKDSVLDIFTLVGFDDMVEVNH